MPACKPKVPSYCRHRSTGRAFVTIEGQRVYLGRFGTEESHARYRRLIAEWLATGSAPRPAGRATAAPPYAVADLVADFLRDPLNYYEKNGKPTSENTLLRLAFRHLLRHHAEVPVSAFDPRAMRTVIATMIETDLSRQTINKYRSRILRLFRWGVSHALIPVSIFETIRTVPGLRKGRSAARESPRVRPVSNADIEATLPHLSEHVRAIVLVQRHSAARPGEVVGMRMGDLDLDGPVVDGVKLWVYVPESWKLDHREDAQRVIYLGPRAQEALRRFLKPIPNAYLFSPTDAENERKERMREARKTPFTPSRRSRDRHRAEHPRSKVGDHYTVASYRRAVRRACRAAGIDPWSPGQLRHTALSELRKLRGIEAAATVAGHSNVRTTQIYAERDLHLASEVVAQLG